MNSFPFDLNRMMEDQILVESQMARRVFYVGIDAGAYSPCYSI
jgi:hypothetical protein